LLAPPALGVLGLELADAAVNFFVHANVALPQWIEMRLRRVVITPDMHRIHHSEVVAEQNANFGIVFPWWDRLFGTYRPEPSAGQEAMTIGIEQFRDSPEVAAHRRRNDFIDCRLHRRSCYFSRNVIPTLSE